MSDLNMNKKKSAFRLKKEKDIIYPILYNCSINESNQYWKQLFNDLSRGMCPKGLTIKNGVINGSISRKNNIVYNFINDDQNIIQNKIKELFSNLLTSEHKNNKKENDLITDAYNDFKKLEWKNIKKKNIKEFLIQQYIVCLKNKYNIKLNKLNSIYNTIMDAIYVYKTHSNVDINYSDGIILDIIDIEYDSVCKTIVNKRLEGESIKIIDSNFSEDLIDDDKMDIDKELDSTYSLNEDENMDEENFDDDDNQNFDDEDDCYDLYDY